MYIYSIKRNHMKINISIDDVVNDETRLGSKTVEISLPISWHSASERYGFNMKSNGIGSYMGPNQMFGGPVGGELVLFDNTERPFYAIITNWTQDHVTRECKLKFLCWKGAFWSRVEDGVFNAMVNEELHADDLLKFCYHAFGFDRTVDLNARVSAYRLKQFIQAL